MREISKTKKNSLFLTLQFEFLSDCVELKSIIIKELFYDIVNKSRITYTLVKNMKTQIKSLNNLLASVSVSIANAKYYHWLIKGNNFFVLHEKFNEYYEFLAEHQDKIAERILSLGDKPDVGYSVWLKNSYVKESKAPTEKIMLEEVLSTLDKLILLSQKAKDLATKANDDETDNYLQDFIYQLQKLHWQYGAQLGYN
jgi:starvation-inducible DNA-binding protein